MPQINGSILQFLKRVYLTLFRKQIMETDYVYLRPGTLTSAGGWIDDQRSLSIS
jgi:hypothetical protein